MSFLTNGYAKISPRRFFFKLFLDSVWSVMKFVVLLHSQSGRKDALPSLMRSWRGELIAICSLKELHNRL